ncbi:uncharacterized protein LOC143037697 isoform X1 [Oratosquilla oratoria]|uniref:uncharacterized protein LOC143037697 isoform X1 n=1 Tax=Oratosquilla oratoria TaxID=337810 RepID=UPI003F768758
MDDEKLVLAVQRQSAIYDKRNPKHRNRDALRMMWNECAAELGTDNVDRLKKRWGYLRDYFMKQYRDLKATKPGDGTTKRTKWPLFTVMSFLIPYIEQKEEPSNLTFPQKFMDMEMVVGDCKSSEAISDTEENSVDNNLMQDKNIEESSCNSKNIQDSPQNQLTSCKRPMTTMYSLDPRPKKKLYVEPKAYDLEILAALRKSDELDEDDHFFKSLKPMLRQMDPIQKINFRIEVQKLLLQFFLPTSSALSSPSLQPMCKSLLESP